MMIRGQNPLAELRDFRQVPDCSRTRFYTEILDGIVAGIQDFHRAPMGIFNPDGQINEGAGPDADTIRFRDDTGTYTITYEVLLFKDDDMAPIGHKGLGILHLSKKVKLRIRRERNEG